MQRNHAFTLVGLSTVIVCIGLIAGAVLIAQGMLRDLELRSVTKDYSTFKAAIFIFKDQYKALPGDMGEATTFFNGVHNGDNNNILDSKESYQLWTHLSMAELIEGEYTGASGPDHPDWDAVIGSNVPASKIDGVGFSAIPLVYDTGDFGLPAISGKLAGSLDDRINQILMGTKEGVRWTGGAFLTPTELWNIDSKIDDGKPGTGAVVAASYPDCIESGDQFTAASPTAAYNRNLDEITCSIIFMPEGTGLE